MEISRKWRFSCLLLGLLFLATTLQGVQGEAESEGPSESECRPYIEKALKELETAEPVDPGAPGDGEVPLNEATADDSEHYTSAGEDDTEKIEGAQALQKEQPPEESLEQAEETKEDEKSAEATPSEEAEPSAEATVEPQVESLEEEQAHESATADESEAQAESQELPPDAQPESQEAQLESQEAQPESQEAPAESQEAQSEPQAESQEAPAESQEQADAPAESQEAPVEEPVTESQEEPTEPVESIEATEAAESEVAEADKVEGESTEAATESADEEAPAESTEAPVEAPAESAEAPVESAEAPAESAEAPAESVEAPVESVEAPVESAEAPAESVEAPAESAEATAESVEAPAESAEEPAESAEAPAESAEAQAESAEAPAESAPTEVPAEVPAESAEVPVEESEATAAESAEAPEVPTESAEAAPETTVDAAEAPIEEAAIPEAEPEEAGIQKRSIDDVQAAETSEAAEESKEAVPEEDLTQEMDVPENLRERNHIDQLLKLDDSNLESEAVLNRLAEITLRDLKRVYENAIKPLETLYKYRDLSNRHFGDSEIFSKPLVLFMGPWSGGKSSIINYLLNNEYNATALRTGAEPSPAYFNLLMYGDEPEVLDGTQLAADFTFAGLQKFGQGLEERLRGLKLPSKLLEKINIVEIPGILEVRKQVSRMFPFNDACQWFIDRADIIFLVYDPSKLDVGPETEAILDQLKGREHQTRIILNKADQVKPEELMRVQGALIWNISPLMSSAQPPVMYTTSLWSRPYEAWAPVRLLQAQERAFLRDLRSAVDKRIENKISSARRFAVRVRNHAKMVDCYLTTYYNHKSVFGNRKQVSDQIIEHPQDYHIYEGLSTLTNISRYDLPDPDVYRDFFRLNPLYDFQQLSATCTYFRGCPINRLDVAIAYDLPEMVGKHKKLLDSALAEIKGES